MMSQRPKGLFFEEFNIGDTFESADRMITEEDIKSFSELSGDHSSIHIDEDYARSTIFGERIAHGLLGLSLVSGLAAKLGFAEETIIALRSIDWKFKSPIKISDSIRGWFMVSEKRKIQGSDSGLVVFNVKVINQVDEIIQTGKWVMIIKREETIG
jgi:acyl dehydratase